MRYLKNLNGIRSGVLCSRRHNSLIFKRVSCLAGNFKMAAEQTVHFRFSLISRELDEISKKIKRLLFRFSIFWMTHFFDFQNNILFGGKFQNDRLQTDHFRISLISRDLIEISKKIKRPLFRFCIF